MTIITNPVRPYEALSSQGAERIGARGAIRKNAEIPYHAWPCFIFTSVYHCISPVVSEII